MNITQIKFGQTIKTDQDIVGLYWGPDKDNRGEDMHHVILPDAFGEPKAMVMVGRRFKPYFPHGGM